LHGGNPAKIEDITFDVAFGDTSGATPKQWACYPVQGASPVMVVKNDGSLFPTAITGIDSPKSNTARGCSLGDVGLGTSLQDQTIADWEDEDAGLDALMHIYCSGRGSWGTAGPVGNYAGEGVSPSYCKDSSSTSCPATKPTASPGSRSDYMHLWAAGALGIRKSALGARLPVVRQRLKCGANDGDPGIAGYTLFVLGYLGDDADAKSFLQTQASASGDIGTIAKAALYLMGDTTQKSAVQAGVQSSSVWVKVACAGALGIVDKDDASVNSAIIPEVKWIEPDTLGGTTDNGKGMYAGPHSRDRGLRSTWLGLQRQCRWPRNFLRGNPRWHRWLLGQWRNVRQRWHVGRQGGRSGSGGAAATWRPDRRVPPVLLGGHVRVQCRPAPAARRDLA
jgi:hypothetical protein